MESESAIALASRRLDLTWEPNIDIEQRRDEPRRATIVNFLDSRRMQRYSSAIVLTKLDLLNLRSWLSAAVRTRKEPHV